MALKSTSSTGCLLAQLHDALDGLLAADVTCETDGAVLDALREAERLRNRLAALDHRLVGQVESRGLGYTTATRDTAGLLVDVLRISSAQAHARVRAAADCGPRRSISGELLAPRFPDVADAQAAGDISAEHARTITSTMQNLPNDVSDAYAETVHDTLLGLARVRGPEVLGRAARHALVIADQDGAAPADDERCNQRRGLTINQRPDGSAGFGGELNAECAELLLTYLDAHAAPRPATSGAAKDPRNAAQRRHDALFDGLKSLVRTEDLHSSGGAAVTVLLTMSADDWLTGRGHASTGHGAVIPAAEAVRWAAGDARVMAVAVDHLKSVVAYSSTRRIFTRTQRLAMDARDKGCTFPGCVAPPGWCEAHHVTDYAQTGRTSIDDGALACGYDHRERIAEGWTTTMIDGRPHWVPPPWIDPQRTPVRNTMHDLE